MNIEVLETLKKVMHEELVPHTSRYLHYRVCITLEKEIVFEAVMEALQFLVGEDIVAVHPSQPQPPRVIVYCLKISKCCYKH